MPDETPHPLLHHLFPRHPRRHFPLSLVSVMTRGYMEDFLLSQLVCGPRTTTELATRLRVSKHTIYRTVNRLLGKRRVRKVKKAWVIVPLFEAIL